MEPLGNVHERASSFVGREAVLDDLGSRFDRGARLVTLLAPGGMGKTRVAQRFAARSAEAWSAHGAGGVWFCDLTAARGESDVAAILGETLGVPLDRGDLDAAAVGRALARRKRVLVVLDNCENVVEALRAQIPVWTSRAPSAQLLATSRVVLGVDGEELVPLAPLAPRAEGVELFVQRARARNPSFDPKGAELERAQRIVDRLDGIPLAIELAAARALVLTLGEIEARLDAPLDLLVRRDGAGKHDSMRGAIADSFAQLGEREQSLFAALSIFRSAFGMRAAERVLGGVVPSVLDAMELLVGRSIVNVAQTEEGARFTLYEAIREFAAEQLARRPALQAELHARHAAYFADVREDPRIEDAAADIAAAHAYALGAPFGATSSIVALTLSLDRALARYPQRRLAMLVDVVPRVESAPDADAAGLAAVVAARGRASRDLGRLDDAAQDFERSLALDDVPTVELRLAELVETQGDTPRALEIARRTLERALHAAPGPARDALLAEAHARIGHVHRREGRIIEAQRETELAVAIERARGPSEGLAFALYEAAVLALFRGQHEASMAAFDEGLAAVDAGAARTPLRARLLLARAALTTGRGTLLGELGRATDAIALHSEAARIFADLGDPHREASALYYWAGAYLETRASGDAETLLVRALEIVVGIGVPRYEALVSGALAVAIAHRAPERARALLAQADAAAERCAREGALVATLAIHRLHVDALVAGHGADRARTVESAQAIAARFECDDPRFALRALDVGLRVEPPAMPPTLRMAADARWFHAPDGDAPVDLGKRAPLQRIFAALAARRQASPGDRLGLDEIVEAGWPGERMKVDAAANRVYVALATLRKLGLRSVLSSGVGGYYLDPAIPLVVAP